MRSLALALLGCLMVSAASAQVDTSEQAVKPGPSEAPASQTYLRSKLVGKWFGSQPTKDGGNQSWTIIRRNDGRYEVTFRIYGADGASQELQEVGFWGVSGPVYFTIFVGQEEDGGFVPSDPADASNYDAYRIIELSSERFEYEHFVTGNRYVVKKVDDDFQLPQWQPL